MIGIVIVTNGHLGREMFANVEQIVGPQPGMTAISVCDGDGYSAKDRICQAIDQVDAGAGVIVLTDIKGSSPANFCETACAGSNRVIISGVNMPMLIKLAKVRRQNLPDAAAAAVRAGRNHIYLEQCG